MQAMALAWNRLAAAVAVTALLACSSLGLCWRQLGGERHECCAGGETMSAPVNPCGSPVATVSPVKLPTPQAATALPVLSETPPAATLPPSPRAFSPSFRVMPPPLVLRI